MLQSTAVQWDHVDQRSTTTMRLTEISIDEPQILAEEFGNLDYPRGDRATRAFDEMTTMRKIDVGVIEAAQRLTPHDGV